MPACNSCGVPQASSNMLTGCPVDCRRLQPPAMAAPQLMRCVLAKLAALRTFEKGLFMSRDADSDLPSPPAASAFHQRFEVVFVDASGWLNLMGGVTASALQHVSRKKPDVGNRSGRCNRGELHCTVRPLHSLVLLGAPGLARA